MMMSYDTFDYTLSGYPSSFAPKRVSKILKQDTEAGYTATAPAFTKDYWIFTVGWNAMQPDGYVYLVNFFHSHRGGLQFYFRWPTGIFGEAGSRIGLSDNDITKYYTNAPDLAASPGSTYPFGSEKEQGFGHSPIYLVKFDMDELESTLIMARKNLWQVNVTLRHT
jgi:hypothetical protein